MISYTPANSPCLLCGCPDSAPQHTFRFDSLPRPFELRRCTRCGLIFNSPRLTDLTRLYTQNYYVFAESDDTRYRRAAAQIKRHLDPRHFSSPAPLDILEIGPAAGHLLHLLRRLGHTVRGVELSPAAADTARRRFRLDIFTGSLHDYAASPLRRRHDLLWCNDVLEHLPDPLAFVRTCAALLKPTGRLILDTPNAASPAVRHNHHECPAFNPYHIFLFTPDNLIALARLSRLTPVTCFSYHNDPTDDRAPDSPLHRLARNCLRATRLLAPLRRFRAACTPTRQNRPPLTDAQIDHLLAQLHWFTQSPDAHAPLAASRQGHNLVLHALNP